MNFVVFNLDNLEACRLIRRYLLSSVHQDTIVEEAADQARDHGHDVIATWLEVCCCRGGVQICLVSCFIILVAVISRLHSFAFRLRCPRRRGVCYWSPLWSCWTHVLLTCSQWVRRILLTDSHLDIEKLSHDGLTPLDVARKSGKDDGWLEPEPRIISVR